MVLQNILFVTSEIHPNSAQGVRYTYLIKHLSQQFNITHLTYNSNLFSPAHCHNLSVTKPRMNSKFIFLLIKAKKYLFNTFSFPDRFIFEIKRYNRIVKQMFDEKCFDTIIIGMTPFSFYKIGKFIKNLDPQIKLIADLSDPFTGSAVVLKKATIYNSIRKRFESKYINFFDKIVVLNERIMIYYSNTFEFALGNMHVIEQGIDENFVKSFREIDIKVKERTDTINFIYAGGFYKHFREPFFLYSAIETFPDDILLNIYGGIKKEFLPIKSKRIFYHGFINNIELVKLYAAADVIVMIDNAIGMQVPGKTIECLAISKPVLFIYENEESPTLRYVKEANGIIICKNEINEIIKALAIIVKCYTEVAKSFDYSKYTWISLADKYKAEVIE